MLNKFGKKEQTKKDYKFEVKAMDNRDEDVFLFEGNASPFDGKADQGGDIVVKGAYKQTLKQKGPKRVLLWHHDSKEPLGGMILEETKEGLMIKEGRIEKKDGFTNRIASLVDKGDVKGLSIGYRAEKVDWKGDNRILKEIDLREVSLLPFPMDEEAGVTGIKEESGIMGFTDMLAMVASYSNMFKGSSEGVTKEHLEAAEYAIKSLNSLVMKHSDILESIVKGADPIDDNSNSEKALLELTKQASALAEIKEINLITKQLEGI